MTKNKMNMLGRDDVGRNLVKTYVRSRESRCIHLNCNADLPDNTYISIVAACLIKRSKMSMCGSKRRTDI